MFLKLQWLLCFLDNKFLSDTGTSSNKRCMVVDIGTGLLQVIFNVFLKTLTLKNYCREDDFSEVFKALSPFSIIFSFQNTIASSINFFFTMPTSKPKKPLCPKFNNTFLPCHDHVMSSWLLRVGASLQVHCLTRGGGGRGRGIF